MLLWLRAGIGEEVVLYCPRRSRPRPRPVGRAEEEDGMRDKEMGDDCCSDADDM